MAKHWVLLKWVLMLLSSVTVIMLTYRFHDQLGQFRSLGLLGIFLANLLGSATIFLPAPAIATVVAGATLYPPIFVGLVATVGAVAGDMVGYVIGISSKHTLPFEKYHWYAILRQLFKKYGSVMIFLFALIPNPIFDAIGIIAGAFGYPWYKFMLWLLLGRLIRNMVLVFFGLRIEAFLFS